MPVIQMADGIHTMTADEYRQIDRYSQSELKWMRECPHKYFTYRQFPPAQERCMVIGEAMHCQLLDLQRMRDRFCSALPCSGYTKKGLPCSNRANWCGIEGAFCSVHQPPSAELVPSSKIILSDSEVKEITGMVESVKKVLGLAPGIRETEAESVVLWTDGTTGAPCKARLDLLAADRTEIWDVKRCQDASPKGFARAIERYGYHIQAAYYCDGIEALTGKAPSFTLAAVESSWPYESVLYTLSEAAIATGRSQYKDFLAMALTCKDRGVWPGYAPTVLDLPAFSDKD